MDPDGRRIHDARKINPQYKFELLSGKQLPVSDKSLDFVLIIAVLHHICSEEIACYLHDFRRVLKHSGRILVIEPCLMEKSIFNNFFMTFFDNGRYIRNANGYIKLFTSNRYRIDMVKTYKQLFFYNKVFFSALPA